VLAGPDFVVPPVPDPGLPRGIGWLRTTVSGSAPETPIGGGVRWWSMNSPGSTRPSYTAWLLLGPLPNWKPVAGPVDLMARVARGVPVELLAEALGLLASRRCLWLRRRRNRLPIPVPRTVSGTYNSLSYSERVRPIAGHSNQ
jgi:hypothetical protein